MGNQGKNKRKQLEFYDDVHNINLSIDSDEEYDFLNWCCEAKQLSILNDFQYQPDAFRLFEAQQYKDISQKVKSLFREHVYTPDFIITFDGQKYFNLAKEFKVDYDQLSSECSVYIDVKGEFARNDGGRSFSINQKWMWQKFKIYVYKLIPKNFCKKFGVALNSFMTKKTKKARKMFSGYPKIKDIFK